MSKFGGSESKMRQISPLICFCWLLALGGSALSQNKVAEGEYQMRDLSQSGSPNVTMSSRWVLYTKSDGGYHLASEIQNVPNGMRVVQSEELDRQLVPLKIGFDLYSRNETKPITRVTCAIEKTSVTCHGDDSVKGAAPTSAAYDVRGPFIFWLRDLASFDIAWQMGGALNMAYAFPAKAAVKILLVTGGSASMLTDKLTTAALEAVKSSNQTLTIFHPEHYTDWEFNSEEETLLEVVGKDEIEINGKKIIATHYLMKDMDGGATDFWMTPGGLLLKLTDKGNTEFVLNNYRQWKNFVPELMSEEESNVPPQKRK
jgi:hypothetical protein